MFSRTQKDWETLPFPQVVAQPKKPQECILLEANQSKELYNKLFTVEGLKEKYEKECSTKDSRIEDLKGSWAKETNSLNTKIENLERCILLVKNNH